MTYEEIILTLAQRKHFTLPDEPIEYSWTELRDIIAPKHSESLNTLGVKLTRSLKQLKNKNLVIHPYRGAKYRLSPEGHQEREEIIRRQSKSGIEFFMAMTVQPFFNHELVKDGKLISYEEYCKRNWEMIKQHFDAEMKKSYKNLETDFDAWEKEE